MGGRRDRRSRWRGQRRCGRLGLAMVLAVVCAWCQRGVAATIMLDTYSASDPNFLTITPFPLTNNANNQPVATNNQVNINFTMAQAATVDSLLFQAWEWRNPGTFNLSWFVNNTQVGTTFLTPAPTQTQALTTNVEFDFDGTKELLTGDLIRINFVRVTSMSGSSSTAMRLNIATDSIAPIAIASGAGGNLVTPFAFRVVPEPAVWPVLACGLVVTEIVRRREGRRTLPAGHPRSPACVPRSH